jgi:hypothetical protein
METIYGLLELRRVRFGHRGFSGSTGATSATILAGTEVRRRRVLDFVHGKGSQSHRREAGVRAKLVELSRGQTGALEHDFDDERRLGVPASMADSATGGAGLI